MTFHTTLLIIEMFLKTYKWKQKKTMYDIVKDTYKWLSNNKTNIKKYF